MSTTTTPAAGTPAASAAANTAVASSETTGSSLASTPVVTSTVTTPSSPMRTMSLGDYKKTRGNALFARDELEALFDVGSDADMEDGEEEVEGTSCGPDCGIPSCSRGPLGRFELEALAEIQSRFGSTAPPSQYALYSYSGIIDDDVTKELDFDPATDKGAITTSDFFMISDGTEIRKLPPTTVLAQDLRPSAALVVAGFALRQHCRNVPHSAALTYRGSEEILSNEDENDQGLGSGSDDQQFAGRSSELPPVSLAVGVVEAGGRRGSGPPDSVDRLEAVGRLQTAEFAALRQELALLKAQIAQVSQTTSNVQVDLRSKLSVLRARRRALEQASALSHQD
ncbi:unnamed protein product [Phytophthora fragariaefolia]|uniref:Unnamed protein product n=1 Tax=Phytophthora fragariaefolia TaxID=1490495 RepID=A0A9W6U6T8_9STRA|nr:unnamed protein product [Phytophthora fragariaefolia]